MIGLSLSEEARKAIAGVLPRVVLVGERSGHGSGILWEKDLVITNHHVAGSERPSVLLEDGTRLSGRTVARDRKNDLAAIAVPSVGRFGPVEVGDATSLRAGQLVVSAGHPLGRLNDVSVGIVSGVERGSWMGKMRRDLLQLDLSLAPGSSGGPIFDVSGKIMGIACMVASPGIGLAVPSNVVASFVRKLKLKWRTSNRDAA